MALVVLGLCFQLLSVVCFALVLLHGFGRSIGTGVMVLLLPPYNIVYGFTQFEHRRKGLVLAGWLGGFIAGIVLRSIGFVAR